MTASDAWVDPDDYPAITSEQFERAALKIGGKVVREAKRRRDDAAPAAKPPSDGFGEPTRRPVK